MEFEWHSVTPRARRAAPPSVGAPTIEPLDTACVGLMARSLPSPMDPGVESGVIASASLSEADAFLASHADARARELALPVFRDFAHAALKPGDEIRVSVEG